MSLWSYYACLSCTMKLPKHKHPCFKTVLYQFAMLKNVLDSNVIDNVPEEQRQMFSQVT